MSDDEEYSESVFTDDNVLVHTLFVTFRASEAYGLILKALEQYEIESIHKLREYCFITFVNAPDAQRFMHDQNINENMRIHVRPADTWHQPDYKLIPEHTQPDELSMFDLLNDDCMLEIFSYLDFSTLFMLEKVSQRLQTLVTDCFNRIHTLDTRIIVEQSFTICMFRKLLYMTGSSLRNLTISSRVVNISRFLKIIAKFCTCLENVHFQELFFVNLQIDLFKTCFENISSLYLTSCTINDDTLEYLLKSETLRDIQFTDIYGFVGKCLVKKKNLIRSSFDSCSNLQPSFFLQFCKNNKNTLKYLNINRCDRLRDINFIQHLPHLDHLIIDNGHGIMNTNFLGESGQQLKVRKLKIEFATLEKVDVLLTEALQRDQIEYLDVSGPSYERLKKKTITDVIAKFKNLRVLNLNNKQDVDDDILKAFTMSKQLEELHVSACMNLTHQSLLDFIQASDNLKILDISGCPKINDKIVVDIKGILVAAKRPHKLKLIVGGTAISKDILQQEILKTVEQYLKLSFENNIEIDHQRDVDDDTSDEDYYGDEFSSDDEYYNSDEDFLQYDYFSRDW